MPTGYSPKLPLTLSDSDGYTLTKTPAEMASQNFKNLMLTSPGERIMDPEFGAGLRRYLFEQNTTLTIREIRGRIQSQVSIYMPYIRLVRTKFFAGGTPETTDFEESYRVGDFFFERGQEENLLYISIEYEIIPLNFKTFLNINVT